MKFRETIEALASTDEYQNLEKGLQGINGAKAVDAFVSFRVKFEKETNGTVIGKGAQGLIHELLPVFAEIYFSALSEEC